ncbi:MAG: hypothetical protein QOI54_3163 [Actinomycetota bacterium]|nr:hypothetical protein [Actinomycetota bacterium]
MFAYDERTHARHLVEESAHPSVRDKLWEEALTLCLAAALTGSPGGRDG